MSADAFLLQARIDQLGQLVLDFVHNLAAQLLLLPRRLLFERLVNYKNFRLQRLDLQLQFVNELAQVSLRLLIVGVDHRVGRLFFLADFCKQ